MNNKNELNKILERLVNGTPKDEKHYAPLNGVKSIQELHQLFVSMDQEEAVASRKKLAQIVNDKPQKPISHEIWYKTTDVINHYPISRRTLANYRNGNKLPYSQIGRNCYYLKSDVDALMFRKYNGKKMKPNAPENEEER